MIVIYNNPKVKPKNSWIKYFLTRIRQNKNNLITVVGPTGSAKTWSSISICEMIAKENKIPFEIDNIIFGLKELMVLVNSGKLKKGSSIIFDEPQVSISSREFQSEANKVFNYLLSTFRHKNLTLFFCTPYEDLLDLSTRKLFHAKLTTMSINRNTKTARLRPVTMEYNSHYSKFYEKFLRVSFKEEGEQENTTRALKIWDVPIPSKEMRVLYERKRLIWTTELNQNIQERLESYERKQKEKYKIKDTRRELTNKQRDVLINVAKHKGNVKEVSNDLGLDERTIYFHLKQSKKKDYDWSEFTKNEKP